MPLADEEALPVADQPYAIHGGRLVLFKNELAGYVAAAMLSAC